MRQLPDAYPSTTFDNISGRLVDEIAALISLTLGIRLKAGGETRFFIPGDDPKGTPHYLSVNATPYLFRPVAQVWILPPTIEVKLSIPKFQLLARFHELSPKAATALVQAARLYQDAIWIAEPQPELTWLMLSFAVERAAQHSHNSKYPPLESMKLLRPKAARYLIEGCGETVAQKVAKELGHIFGATRKFVDFILDPRFLPDPPPSRPSSEHSQHPWTKEALEKSLEKIYDWRSLAVHEGIPFPLPMCLAPFPPASNNVPPEIPTGSATSGRGGTWKKEDTPMHLHIFEHIVRNTLLKWWASLLPEPEGTLDVSGPIQ